MKLETVYTSLIKEATWLGRQVNNIFGHDNFVGRTFGESNDTATQNFFNNQIGQNAIAERQRQAAKYNAQQQQLQARVNRHVDQRMAAMQTQNQSLKNRQVAQQQAKQRVQNQYMDQIAAQRGVTLTDAQRDAIRNNAQKQTAVAQTKPAAPAAKTTPPPPAQKPVATNRTMRGSNVTTAKPRTTRQGYRTPDGVWHPIG